MCSNAPKGLSVADLLPGAIFAIGSGACSSLALIVGYWVLPLGALFITATFLVAREVRTLKTVERKCRARLRRRECLACGESLDKQIEGETLCESCSSQCDAVKPVDYPTADTVAEWDDASLFSAAGCESVLRYLKEGFETLNDAERSLCCLYLLEAEVNNGGFGQWIWNVCPRAAIETPLVLQRIGATEMAAFVTRALQPFGDLTRFPSNDEWLEHYLSCPDEVHEHLETLTRPFLELEDSFLELAYAYARAHWKSVRTT